MSRALPAIAIAVALAVAAAPTRGAEKLEARPPDGKIVVNVWKAGLLSGFAHDHHFEVGDWRGTVEPGDDPGRATVEVVLAAASLHDTQKSLSEADRRKVDAQAIGPEVLDAAHAPGIRFRSERIDLDRGSGGPDHLKGTLHGVLTLRGRSTPVDVAFEGNRAEGGWHVRGTARVKQSAFGITPFSGYGGTVKVKDEMTVDVELTFRPR